MPDEEEETKEYAGFDQVFRIVGGRNRCQSWLLLVAAMSRIITFHHMGYAFLGAVPDHWCKIDDLVDTNWTQEQIRNISIPKIQSNGKIKYDECTYFDLNYNILKMASNFENAFKSVNFEQVEKKSCSQWNYDKSIFLSTVASDFNLVCEQKYLVATIQATYMGGVFLGALILGALSDSLLGRRGTVLVSVVLVIIAGFGASFASSYTVFLLFRFIIAIGVAGAFQNAFTMVMEQADTYYRGIISLVQQTSFAIFYMLMAVYAYFIRDWKSLQLSFTISTLPLISYFWILPESSRWLASKHRKEEALKILEWIAKVNKKPPPNKAELLAILEGCRNPDLEFKSERDNAKLLQNVVKNIKLFGSAYVNLVRTKELRKRSFILWYSAMSVNLVYYGIAFASPSLSDDPFIIVFLGGLVEIPGYLFVIPIATRWGRKPALVTTFFLAGIFCAFVGIAPIKWTWLRIVCSLFGKLFISASFAIVYLLAAELFPTTERATGLGSSVLMGRIGSILAPFIVTMKTIYEDLPTLIFAASALLAGLLALLVPETRNEAMLDNIKAVEVIAERRASQNAEGIRTGARKPSLRTCSLILSDLTRRNSGN